MSLFTVIKYGNTDLSSYQDLCSLRSEFIYRYYKEVDKIRTLGIRIDNPGFYFLVNRLSYQYDTATDAMKADMKRAFLKVLEEYEEWWPQ